MSKFFSTFARSLRAEATGQSTAYQLSQHYQDNWYQTKTSGIKREKENNEAR